MINELVYTLSTVNYSAIHAAIDASSLGDNSNLMRELKSALSEHRALVRAARAQILKQLKEADNLFSAFESGQTLFPILQNPADENSFSETNTNAPSILDESEAASDKEKKKSNRKPAQKPSKTISHGLSPEQKVCSCCGKNMHKAHTKIVTIIRLNGFSKENHELETGRCLTCDTKVEAAAPQEETICSYTIPAAAMITSLRYAYGLPSFRIEDVSQSMGYRIPDSTQWDIFEIVADKLRAFQIFLRKKAAQTEVALMDDTTVRINSLTSQFKNGPNGELQMIADGRTGVHTTGYLAKFATGNICIYHSGLHHAGEFFEKLMQSRTVEEKIILMMDASSSNTSRLKNIDAEVIQANCNSHAVRRFAEAAENPIFEEDSAKILGLYKGIFERDQLLKIETPEMRLGIHRAQSLPEMLKIKKKIKNDFEAKKVEPASQLGGHYKYFLNHFEKLCAFCHHVGAPICNNACERILKRAIRHRKNSLFFKNLVGAAVGDIIMSVLITAKENTIEPVKYITDLLEHLDHVNKNPEAWLPWNYLQTLDVVAMGPPCPSKS